MTARRRVGEPLQYVLGEWSFRHIRLAVDRRVLIPRPETELVAELALEKAAAVGPTRVVADLGTGSGAIGLSMAVELPRQGTTVWITDASVDALDVARANLAGIGPAGVNVRVALGSWFDALPPGTRLDVAVANPPYVAEASPELADDVRDWEPHEALFAGPDGLDAIRTIVADAPAEEVELVQQQVLGHLLLRRHVGDADERQHLVGPAGLEQRRDSCSVCAATTLSSARPWISSSGRVGRRRAAAGTGLVLLGGGRPDRRGSARCSGCRTGATRSPARRRSRRGTRRVDAARRARRGSRRSSSPGWRPGRGRAPGTSSATAWSASTWSSRVGPARSPCTARSHRCPGQGCHDRRRRHGEALVGEPLRREVRVVGLHHAQRVGSAVGVEQHRQRRAVVIEPPGSSTAAGQLAVADGEELHVRLTSGVSANEAISWGPPGLYDRRRPGRSSVAVRTTVVAPPTAAPWTPVVVVIGHSSATGPLPHVELRRVVDRVGAERDDR
jgi:methylase of polypeptide subunit release factors